jgi:hypothetical protein
MGESNLTIRRKTHTSLQKWARKSKALLKEAEGSIGAYPARTSGGVSAVPIDKRQTVAGDTPPLMVVWSTAFTDHVILTSLPVPLL